VWLFHVVPIRHRLGPIRIWWRQYRNASGFTFSSQSVKCLQPCLISAFSQPCVRSWAVSPLIDTALMIEADSCTSRWLATMEGINYGNWSSQQADWHVEEFCVRLPWRRLDLWERRYPTSTSQALSSVCFSAYCKIPTSILEFRAIFAVFDVLNISSSNRQRRP
jgi:hypothetical protein